MPREDIDFVKCHWNQDRFVEVSVPSLFQFSSTDSPRAGAK